MHTFLWMLETGCGSAKLTSSLGEADFWETCLPLRKSLRQRPEGQAEKAETKGQLGTGELAL